jgi:sarcosine oxidase gamma subunit
MRDLSPSWPSIPDWRGASLDRNGNLARTVLVGPQHLVSGNLARFATAAGLPDTGVGAFADISGERYALRIARDRMLVVNAPTASTPPGWHADGYAITDVSAMYHVFEFEGPGLADLIAEAMFVDPRAKSPSAATMFAGQQAIVYHHNGKLRVHIERGFAPYVWQWLEARD